MGLVGNTDGRQHHNGNVFGGTWDYETGVAMGLVGNTDGRQHHNGNVFDTANSAGEQHSADRTIQPNLDAVRALRPSRYKGAHRA